MLIFPRITHLILAGLLLIVSCADPKYMRVTRLHLHKLSPDEISNIQSYFKSNDDLVDYLPKNYESISKYCSGKIRSNHEAIILCIREPKIWISSYYYGSFKGDRTQITDPASIEKYINKAIESGKDKKSHKVHDEIRNYILKNFKVKETNEVLTTKVSWFEIFDEVLKTDK